MHRKAKKILTSFALLGFFLFIPGLAKAEIDGNFNPAYIIGNEEVLDYGAMTLDEIDAFLKSKDGYLAGYSTTNPDGKMMTAAEIIYDRAQANKVNPKFIIVLLQKEMSLIDDTDPKQSQLDWATGYGCFDGASCNERWRGFWKQVNSASMQFRDYMDNPDLYSFKAGETHTFRNRYGTIETKSVTVKIANQATAALYNYTPHVFNGNYNFYKIWKRWFSKTYPDGTLLQASGDKDVWLVQTGRRRKFSSKSVLLSRYDANKIITIGKDELERYEIGPQIKFPQYSLVKSPKGTIYLLIDNKKHGIASKEAFRKIGFNPEEVISGSQDDLNAYADGPVLSATTTYPFGQLLQDKKTGGVYWVINNTKAPIMDRIFLKTKFKYKKIKAVTPKDLDKFATVPPVLFGDGELLKSDISPGVYVIADGHKRPFITGEVFELLGYKWSNIITVPQKVLDLYPSGESIDLIKREEIPTSTPDSIELYGVPATSTVEEIISTSTLLIKDQSVFGNIPTGTIINASSTN